MRATLEYAGIRVKDLEASVRFYTKVLGMIERGRKHLGETRGVLVELIGEGGGVPLELNWYERGSTFDTPYVPGEGLDHLGFRVSDLERAVAEAQKAGYPVIQEIKTATNRWVYIQDPNGIWVELNG